MKRFLLLLVLGVPACAPSAPPPAAPEVVVAVEPEPKSEPNDVSAVPDKIAPEAPPLRPTRVEVPAPVAKALAPTVSPPPLPKAAGPRGRDSEIARGELPLAKPTPAAAPLPPVPRKTTNPSPPAEGVPFRIGDGAELDWRGTKLPEAPTVKSPPRPQPTAADVPRLGFPQPDRIPIDDPTADLSTARIVNTLLVAPTLAAPFLRLMLPDPFEFAEQLKAPAAPEFGIVPVLVPPARP
jgi:hypothetical protein